MSVFARFLRKPKGAEEASTAKAADVTPAADAPAEEGSAPSAPSAASDTPEARTEDAPRSDVQEKSAKAAQTPDAAGCCTSRTGAVAEPVEIPKQQSAEQAADNEAGEGARK
ncbi:hypothetical protein [Streptomyces uncialis]|uniref:Gliding motility protein n=1 Tax=Streptomyces uncialis TaxID=1048205 RepID=A0A1Q4V605_9ACTN|nr:hypothetical protein [Streptomyces uncialis]OKH93278.1 hypothetical protein AB852_17160 [Streptomyces uncialis]